jgi:SAM-dependent methyltransferase
MKSYIITSLGALSRINELWNLYRNHKQNVKANARGLLEQAIETESKINLLIGAPVTGLKMLELGPGQLLVQLAYFAMRNEITGIDLDVILQYLNWRGCLQMARKNGWIRFLKTVGRKMARVDNSMRAEIMSQLGLKTMPALRVLQMDAMKMQFPDDQFDVVYSRAVFEHLPDPEAVISEIRRVLKPGGLMLMTLHLFTSDSGCHDSRIFLGKRGGLPYWAHLRPEFEQAVRSNSYLNKLRLDDWRQAFQTRMPGSRVTALCDAGVSERQELVKLRSQGQLTTYSDDELLTVTVEVSWRKPLYSSASD